MEVSSAYSLWRLQPLKAVEPESQLTPGKGACIGCRDAHDITDEEAGILAGLGPDALKRSTAQRVGSMAKRVAKLLSTPVTGCYNNVKVKSSCFPPSQGYY